MDWALPNITGYWDQSVRAIERLSRELKAAPPKSRAAQQSLIRAAVGRGIGALSNRELMKAASVMADDLYQAAGQIDFWDDALEQYLSASSGAFLAAVSARGYVVNYVIDNRFEDLAAPVRRYPRWFTTADLFYICPQHLACWTMKDEDKPEAEWQALMPNYIERARELADAMVARCRNEGRHFVFLATDSNAACFSAAMRTHGLPGVIRIFRREPPSAGGKCVVTFPATSRMIG
ncbi:MAG TPA: hypothetical protein VIX89_07505 [Bryobacteraceae bacterium]